MKIHRSFGPMAMLSLFALVGAACRSATDSNEPAAADANDDLSKWPTTFSLPNGFQPEGIAIGTSPIAYFAYFGSLADGSIYRVNLRNGEGSILSAGPGTQSVGLKLDARQRLFVAGGSSGGARVLDANNGQVLRSYQFATDNTFVNDVIITQDAAWFTDSTAPVLYKVPLGGQADLPADGDVVRVPFTGDLVYTEGTNVNGITTSPDGRSLIVVTTTTGKLYRVDPGSGATRTIDVGGVPLTNGDGLLREGRTLYVVRNQSNEIVVIELADDASSGKVTGHLTDPRFDVPPTVASFGRRLYLPNARFTTTPTPTTTYNVVAVDKP
ncbi:hypothetical protein LZC95_02445 [Pendulispora brunnea]|uniref:Superoxide dismutase n=1 Tax=Pendulispora brunnea TaxID=2905690 RepID=A0ABZ2KAJ6_9BACT